MASYFFSFLNMLLPKTKTDQLSEPTLSLLQQADFFTERFSTQEYLSGLFPSMERERVNDLAVELENIFSTIATFIDQALLNDLPGDAKSAKDGLNFFVLASTIQAVCHPPFLHFLHGVMNKAQLRDFENSSTAGVFESLMAKLSQNREQLLRMFGIDVQAEPQALMPSAMSAILLFAFGDVDACIELLDERLSYLVSKRAEQPSLADLFDVVPVGRFQRFLGSEQTNQAVVRRIERALLANRPEGTNDPLFSTLSPEVLKGVAEYCREISYSMRSVFDRALLSYKANQLVGVAHQERMTFDLTRSAERACFLLRDQLCLLKKTPMPPALTESLARLKVVRSFLSEENALLDPSSRTAPLLTDPRTGHQNKLFTRFVIQSITQAPASASESMLLTFSPPIITRNSIQKAIEKREDILPQYHRGIVDALSYFYLEIPERLQSSPEKFAPARLFFENWSMLQHHGLINIISTIHLEMIREFELVESENNKWQIGEEETVSALLAVLRDNQNSLLNLHGASFGITNLQDMYRLFLFNFDHVMLKLVGMLIRREAALSALDHFFETTAKTKRGKNVLRRLAKAVTLLLPKENQALDGRIRALTLDRAEVKADALRRSIDVARRAAQANPFKEVMLAVILHTNTTRHLLESFIGQLATLPWKQDIASLVVYRDTFFQAHTLRDATIFGSLQSMLYFIRSSQDRTRVEQLVAEFKNILPAYVNARLVYAWFLCLPQELSRLLVDGRELMLNHFESKIHHVFFPQLPLLWDHCDLLSLNERVDDSFLFSTENQETEPRLTVRYSYTLAMYMIHYPQRTRLRSGVTQADLDQVEQHLLALSSDALSPVLSVNHIRAMLASVFFPLAAAQIEFTFFEINTYRIQRWLSEKLFLALSSDREVSAAFLNYTALQHNNIIESVTALKSRFIDLIHAGCVGEWGQNLTDALINTMTNQANKVEMKLTLMKRQSSKQVSFASHYWMELDRLEQQIASSPRPEVTLNAAEPELRAAISGLAKVITWHHHLQWASLPIEAFFSQDSLKKLEEDGQRLSALIERSLLAEKDGMVMRALRFRRWMLVLENLSALGNIHGYQIVYSAVERMRGGLLTAYSYVRIRPSAREEKLITIPSLFFSITRKNRSVPPPLFKGLLPDQDLRHSRDFFSEGEAFYRSYVNNILMIEEAFLSPDIHAIYSEGLLSAILATASVLSDADIIAVETDDAHRFSRRADNVVSSGGVASVSRQPPVCFTLNRWNIKLAIEDEYFIDTMLATDVTEIELLNTQLFRKDASFLVRLARLFNTHPMFHSVKRFCINNNQRDYEQTVPLEREQYIYTMQFIDVYLPLICRVKVFESQCNGLTGEFLSLLLNAWRSRPEGVNPYPLSHLSLHGNQLGMAADDSHLLMELMHTISLTVLDINQNSFGKHKNVQGSLIEPRSPHQDAQRIADGIRTCVTLEELDIGYNDWGNEGSKILLDAIATLPCLHTLKFSFCGVNKSEVAQKVVNVVEKNAALRNVIYDGNPAFTSEYSQHINTILLARREKSVNIAMSVQRPFSFFRGDSQESKQQSRLLEKPA